MKKGFWTYFILCIVVMATFSFTKGFCSVYPCYTKFELIIPLLELVIFVLYTNRRYVEEKLSRFGRENMGWTMFICITLGLAVLIYYAEVHIDNNPNMVLQKFALDFIKRILGTLIGIWAIYLLLRPRLKIYPILALVRDNNNKLIGKVLVKNTNFTDLFDVQIVLQGCFIDDNGNLKTHDFLIRGKKIPLLRNRLYAIENSHAWCTYKSIEEYLGAFDYIRCRVIATHSLSGIHFITEHLFTEAFCVEGDYDNNNNFKQ